jgi:hypothetical protein
VLEPQYVVENNKKVCINAKMVIDSIRRCFPQETYKSLAERAGVHIQTIFRWVSVDRAEESAMRRLVLCLEQDDDFNTVLLKDAKPWQLKKQCQIIGWDNILNAPKRGEIFMKIEDAQIQIAEKLEMDNAWAESLNDTSPGVYQINDWEIDINPYNIFVNFPKMEFSFSGAIFNFNR